MVQIHEEKCFLGKEMYIYAFYSTFIFSRARSFDQTHILHASYLLSTNYIHVYPLYLFSRTRQARRLAQPARGNFNQLCWFTKQTSFARDSNARTETEGWEKGQERWETKNTLIKSAREIDGEERRRGDKTYMFAGTHCLSARCRRRARGIHSVPLLPSPSTYIVPQYWKKNSEI